MFLDFKKWVKSIQTAGYNGSRRLGYFLVFCHSMLLTHQKTNLAKSQKNRQYNKFFIPEPKDQCYLISNLTTKRDSTLWIKLSKITKRKHLLKISSLQFLAPPHWLICSWLILPLPTIQICTPVLHQLPPPLLAVITGKYF